MTEMVVFESMQKGHFPGEWHGGVEKSAEERGPAFVREVQEKGEDVQNLSEEEGVPSTVLEELSSGEYSRRRIWRRSLEIFPS